MDSISIVLIVSAIVWIFVILRVLSLMFRDKD